MDTARYFVAVLLVASMPPAIVWWYLVHPFVGFWRRMGARAALSVVGALMLAAAGALVWARDALVGRDLGTSWPLTGLGVVLAVAAAALGLRRRRYLTTRILSGIPELEGDGGNLLTQGPYAVIRHPRYVEVVAAVFAYASFANYAGSWVVALATLPALHGVVLLEERELAQRFGSAYDEYRRRVPRYVPGVTRSTSTMSQSGR